MSQAKDGVLENRQAVEQAMRLGQECFGLIAEHSRELICLVDVQGCFLHVSPSFQRILGYRPETLLGRRSTELVHPDDLPALRQDGSTAPTEVRLRHADGRWVWAEGYSYFVQTAQGPLRVGIGRDISERKRAQERIGRLDADLHRRMAELQTLFDTIPAGIGMATDPQARHIQVNPYLAEVLGVAVGPNAAPGAFDGPHAPYKVFRRGRELAPEEMPIQVAAAQGIATNNDELDILRQDGTVTHLLGYAVPLFDEQEKPRGSVGVFVDISERRRAEQALQESEALLRQAQKMEAIGLLAGGVAHDFRNQLTVIKGYGEMLLRRDLVDPAGREYVREILKAAQRSTNLTGDLLSFSRKEMLQPEIVDLNELVGQMTRTLRSILGEDVYLSLVGSKDPAYVRIDPAQFQHALVNLVVNARDAMPAGGQLTIEIRSVTLDQTFTARHVDSRPGPYVMVAVSDTGIGMPKDVLERIFEPFFTTKPPGQGSGLGLPTVYGFVRQSGGVLDVQSQAGQGSTFRLYFPCQPATVPTTHGQQSPGQLLPGTGTILLAEDEDAIRRLITQTLRDCGYDVLQARNARQAIGLAEHHAGPIDLLITDVVMPGDNGVELARRLRQPQPNLPVLYITGYSGESLIQRGLLEPTANLLVKPFDAQQITQAVRRILQA